MTQPNASNEYYQRRLQDAIYTLRRVTPEHYALYLASILTTHSYNKALQELKQLQDMFSTLTVATRGFTLDTDWQHQEDQTLKEAKAQTQVQDAQGDVNMTPKAAADYLNISKAKVYRYINSGQLAHVNHGSKQKPRYRVKRSVLAAFNPSP